jgi:hypothetical protein
MISGLEARMYRGHGNAVFSMRGGGSPRFQFPDTTSSRRWASGD